MAIDKKKVTLGFRVRFPFVSVSFSYAADGSRDIAKTFSVFFSVCSCVLGFFVIYCIPLV